VKDIDLPLAFFRSSCAGFSLVEIHERQTRSCEIDSKNATLDM
jgi:hypothetical protein